MEDDSGVISLRRQTRKSFILTTIGVFLTFSAHCALRNLQSSLNIEDGLGTTSLSVMEGAALFCGLFLAPVALAFVNVRYGVMLSDVTLLAYVLANFYPAYSTLIPTSVFAGLGKTLFWICINQINIYFAHRLELCGSRDYSTYVSKVSSYFFGAMMATQLFGNLIPFIAFELAASTSSDDFPITNSVTPTVSTNSSTDGIKDLALAGFQHCAANDCQDASITANSSNYKPANEESLQLVIGIFAVLSLAALVLHWQFVPSIDEDEKTPFREKTPQNNPSFIADDGTESSHSNNKSGRQTAISSIELALDHNGNIADLNNNNNNDRKRCTKIRATKSLTSAYICLKEVSSDLIDTWKFFFRPKQLLLFWSQVMVGLNVAFSTSEITRAYVSCVFGVAEVGICMAIYGTLALVASFVSGRVVSLCGRGYPTALAFLLNFGVYFFCLFWKPDETSSVVIVYGLLCFCGIVDGIYQTMSIIAVAIIFPCDTKLAYTWWTVNITIGYFITYAWSTAVCVHDKIYVQAGVLVVAVVTYALTEYVHKREKVYESRKQHVITIDANQETQDERVATEI